ncbi:MAG: LamG domain-containing protein, partial [Saprospiraceae bacterium]|nr:LamG domain-containing protein [Saprospiraceae bacterium]
MFYQKPFTPFTLLIALVIIFISSDSKIVAQGNALNLDGNQDYLTTPHLGIEVKEKTMEAWVKLNDINHMCSGVVGIDVNYSMPHQNFDAITYNETNNGWMLSSEFFRRTTVSGSGVKETSTNEWVHMAVTYKDYDYQLYRNGTLIHQRTLDSAFVFPTNSNIIIGQRHSFAGGSDLNAVIDEVRVWNIARDSFDIQSTMNCSCSQMGAIPSTGLLACYTFDDFGADPVLDVTGNGYH